MSDSENEKSSDNILKACIVRRGTLKGKLTWHEKFLTSFQLRGTCDIVELQERVDALLPICQEFDKIQDRIIEFDKKVVLSEQEDERANFESRYFDLMARSKAILQDYYRVQNQKDAAVAAANAATVAAAQISSQSPSLQQNINLSDLAQILNTKLKPLDIPEFSGGYDKWIPFKNAFLSIVDSNANYSELQKMMYLNDCLKNEAKQVISSLTLSDDNYTKAWQLICDRYDNKKAIIHTHIKSIFELPEITKETHQSLRKFTDSFLVNFRALENLGENVTEWNTILIYLLNTKLTIQTRKEWEIYSQKSKNPIVIQDFIDFLVNRCILLESLDFKLNSTDTNRPHAHFKRAPEYPKSYSMVTTTSTTPPCPLCNQQHFIYACEQFKNIPVNNRNFEIKRFNLCSNCLRPNHSNINCHSTFTCRYCQKRHHSLLHLNPKEFNQMKNPQFNQTKFNQANNFSQNHPNTQNHSTTKIYQPNPTTHLIQNHSLNTESGNSHIPQFTQNSTLQYTQANNNDSTQTKNTMISNQVDKSQLNQSPFQTAGASAQSHIYTPVTQCISNSETFTLLSTINLYIYDGNNELIQCRALLDSASQSNLITEELFNKLNLPYENISLPVAGLGQNLTNISKRLPINIQSMQSKFKTQASFLVVQEITGLMPQMKIDTSKLKIPPYIGLADLEFHFPDKIDMLLGANIFFDVLEKNKINLGKNLPFLQQTKFGYIISGPIPTENSCNKNCLLTTNLDLQQFQSFINSEENYSEKRAFSKEETECEQLFQNTTYQDQITNRFVVQLPLKSNYTQLGQSYNIALSRFQSQERKHLKRPELWSEYVKFMQEYKSLGHMTKLDDKNSPSVYPIYYLPHHMIEKTTSLTTKYRIVFDGSAKTSSNLSLNQVLKVGPTIQNDLFSILISFRKHSVVLIGDLTKMYRQILIDPPQRDLQRIIWRDNITQELEIYQLNTITYGTASASYLSTRCLEQISNEVQTSFPTESSIIQNDMYVDDLLTGSDSAKNVLMIRKNLVQIFNNYGFELRKFSSNNPQVLSDLAQDQENFKKYVITDNEGTKTLGISYDPNHDVFEYNANIILTQPNHVTKRTILSTVSKIFDPLGLLGPLIVQAKIILQKLWKTKLDWDDPIPTDLFRQWMHFYNEIIKINTLKIPRQVIIANSRSIQVHGFSDASQQSYGACIYIRSESSIDIRVRLLCAKSKVAPLQTISLPRLELNGALLLARLCKKVIASLQITISDNDLFYYTDSTIVLAWLSRESNSLKTYECNRVSEIQQLTNTENWYHISSESNPADIISRGINPINFEKSQLWWHGPNFLYNNPQDWPKGTHISNFAKTYPELTETNTNYVNLLTTIYFPKTFLHIFELFSSFQKLVNRTALCLRYFKNLKNKTSNLPKLTGHITVSERRNSTKYLVRLVQGQCFSKEIQTLKNNKQLESSSKLISLSPFVDSENILRVGGRLNNSALAYNHKHPILLPSQHLFTTLIIEDVHTMNLHPGPQATLSFLRKNYWPIHGKQTVRRVLHKCLKCFRVSPKTIKPLMGALPSVRVSESRPFSQVGVDYAGPFQMKDGKYRNRKIIKAYVCIFVCMSTKACHIELVSELSSNYFLSALERFVSRRGLCNDIFSDNGTTFIGANNELCKISKVLQNQNITNFLNNHYIQWHFIPARSPHFGGLWEAAVNSLKHHLKRIVGPMPLTYEELSTVLTKVEAILNSRPITPLSEDPSDLEALSPGHFLIGQPLNALPQEDYTDLKVGYLKRYQHLQKLTQDVWKRWRTDYLHNLQQRTKWRTNESPIHQLIGSLVILVEENVPPLQWPLARITDVHPGKDNIVRVISVKTKTGSVLKRAIAKVCLLPIDSHHDN